MVLTFRFSNIGFTFVSTNLSPTMKFRCQSQTDMKHRRLLLSHRSPELPAQVVARRLQIRAPHAAVAMGLRIYELTTNTNSHHYQGGRRLEPWSRRPSSLPQRGHHHILWERAHCCCCIRIPLHQHRYAINTFPIWCRGREDSAYCCHPRKGRQLKGAWRY